MRRMGLGIGGSLLLGNAAPRLSAQSRTVPTRAPELALINLAGNENPFGPSPRVSARIAREIANSCRYPFRESRILQEDIAAMEGVEPDQILLGKGCDEILSMAGAALTGPTTSFVSARPTYRQLQEYAKKGGATEIEVDHDKKTMQHDLTAMANATRDDTSLIYICNPDTPTGTRLPPEEIEAFVKKMSGHCPILIDEVYLDLLETFAEETQVKLLHQGYPVIITRSFSKLHAIAGLRIGYAIASAEVISKMAEQRMSSLNFLGVAAARASLHDTTFHNLSRRQIQAGRNRFTALLDELKLPYTPSDGNFVFHYTGIKNEEYQQLMREKGFLVGRTFPPYDQWNRLSIGNETEMRAYEQAMREVFG